VVERITEECGRGVWGERERERERTRENESTSVSLGLEERRRPARLEGLLAHSPAFNVLREACLL